jgi:hypothetical protein
VQTPTSKLAAGCAAGCETVAHPVHLGASLPCSCSAINTCRTCTPDGGCSAITKYQSWYADQYNSISGADDMAAEIFARGPISCGVDASVIENYTGGIFKDTVRASFCGSGTVRCASVVS